MHWHDRTVADEPACLAAYTHPKHTWDDVNPCKPAIRESLEKMQKGRCAYCEGPLYHDAHIEHFRRKNAAYFPKLTFTWTNLFLACESRDHCGHYKDRPTAPPYNPDDLVKPDEDKPDDFFFFNWSTGDVRIRGGVDQAAVKRAEETIRVFNLNHPGLRAERRKRLARYLREGGKALDEVLMWPESELVTDWINGEIHATQKEHYSTTIRHFLESKSPQP